MVESLGLTHVDIFQGLAPEQVQRIVAVAREEVYRSEEIIFRENTPGDCMYVIVDGAVEIQVDPTILGEEIEDSTPISLAIIRRGQTFGEVALVDEGVRSASALCHSQQAHLLVIPRGSFLALCHEDLDMGFRVMFNIAAELSNRIRTTDFMLRGRLLLAPTDNGE
jgi:CRP-like cAMP-binding protein